MSQSFFDLSCTEKTKTTSYARMESDKSKSPSTPSKSPAVERHHIIQQVNQTFQNNQTQLPQLYNTAGAKNKKFYKHEKNINSLLFQEIRERRVELAEGDCLNRAPEVSIPALKELQSLLLDTPLNSLACDDLVIIAKALGTHLGPEHMEEKSKRVQIEFIKTLGIIVEQILYYYSEDSLSGVTESFKLKLYNDLEGLKKLAQRKNPHLRYLVKYASEGVKRLQDDSEPVRYIAHRIYHLSLAAACYFMSGNIMLPTEIKKALFNTNIKVNIKYGWYDHVRILQQCANTVLYGDNSKEYAEALAKNETEKFKEAALKTLLYYIYKCEKENHSWSFEYAAVQMLSKIAIEGETENLRTLALKGGKIAVNSLPDRKIAPVIVDVPGLLDAAAFDKHHPWLTVSLTSFIPLWIDHNPVIRYIWTESLLKIVSLSHDYDILASTKDLLCVRLPIEEDLKILKLLQDNVPSTKQLQYKWILDDSNCIPKPSSKTTNSPANAQYASRQNLPNESAFSASQLVESSANVSQKSSSQDFMLGDSLKKRGVRQRSKSHQELPIQDRASLAYAKTLKRASEGRKSPRNKPEAIFSRKRYQPEQFALSEQDSFSEKSNSADSLDQVISYREDSHESLLPHKQALLASSGVFAKEQIEQSVENYTREIDNYINDPRSANKKYYANLLLHRGLCYHLEKQHNLAIIDLKLAYKNDPTLDKATFSLAKIYETMQKKEKALKWAERTLALKPSHEEARQLLNSLAEVKDEKQ